MSEYHVREYRGNQVDVIFHLAVPNTNNAVGVNHRTALVNSKIGGTSVMTAAASEANGLISNAEMTSITTGAIYEVAMTITIPPDLTTNTQLQALVDEIFTTTEAAVLTELAKRLKYFGFSRNVP